MAPRYSKSVLSKIRVYFNSTLDEAVELETAEDSRWQTRGTEVRKAQGNETPHA
jgi:hypothetical protein